MRPIGEISDVLNLLNPSDFVTIQTRLQWNLTFCTRSVTSCPSTPSMANWQSCCLGFLSVWTVWS